MSAIVLMLVTGFGLAGLYFLLAVGLSLIFGLMGVLNMAHGATFALGGYVGFLVMDRLTAIGTPGWRYVLALVLAGFVGFMVGYLIERLLIARFYHDHLAQILLTIGLGLAAVAVFGAVFTYDLRPVPQPNWLTDTTTVLGAHIPNSRWLTAVIALLLLLSLVTFLRRTRHGLIIRAGVENRSMVSALGIDVGRSFTLVFGIGSALATVGGALGAVYFGGASPALGTSQIIFAFIVVVVGGMGSIGGTALAAVVVAMIQQLANAYTVAGIGDIAVVGLLAVVLLVSPEGLLGRRTA
ncbi:MAG: ABC transporter permease [Pseudonocardia sp. SCN 72-86]|nr:MAG: ABC transporter permease [Pseudonocardia sp. SCN 72-86]